MSYNLTIHYKAMRNNRHYQYFLDFGGVVREFDPKKLRVEPEFEAFKLKFDQEDDALKKIRKSPVTAKIQAADVQRRETYRGLVHMCSIATRQNFKTSAKEAAIDLMVILKGYGNIPRLPLSEKTGAYLNLLKDLREKYGELVTAVGLDEWVDELHASNAWCHELMQERWDDRAGQASVVSMKQARVEVEIAYEALMGMLLAQQTVTKDPIYDSFFLRLQVVVDTYSKADPKSVDKEEETNEK